jgi:rhamnosyltransferase
MTPTIGIVLAAYNGEKYIVQQVQSIQAQTHQAWKLYVRDDGSKDQTRSLVAELARHDPRIVLVQDDFGNQGYNRNFFRLLGLTSEAYVAFCDQDDVWLPRKLEALLAPLLNHEHTGQGSPALSHCDSMVTDSSLNVIRPRFIGERGNAPGLDGILFSNTAQGCSMMVNRALADLALTTEPLLPFDWHIALVGCLTGRRYYVNEPLALYRQHGANAVGANVSPGQPRKKVLSSFQLGLLPYPATKAIVASLPVAAHSRASLQAYLMLFEPGGWLQKVLSVTQRRYRMSRKKDTLHLYLLLLTGRSLGDLLP